MSNNLVKEHSNYTNSNHIKKGPKTTESQGLALGLQRQDVDKTNA